MADSTVGIPGLAPRTAGSSRRAFTLVRVFGDGDEWWFDGTVSGPDASTWNAVGMLQLGDGRLLRETGPSLPGWPHMRGGRPGWS